LKGGAARTDRAPHRRGPAAPGPLGHWQSVGSPSRECAPPFRAVPPSSGPPISPSTRKTGETTYLPVPVARYAYSARPNKVPLALPPSSIPRRWRRPLSMSIVHCPCPSSISIAYFTWSWLIGMQINDTHLPTDVFQFSAPMTWDQILFSKPRPTLMPSSASRYVYPASTCIRSNLTGSGAAAFVDGAPAIPWEVPVLGDDPPIPSCNLHQFHSNTLIPLLHVLHISHAPLPVLCTTIDICPATRDPAPFPGTK
jgi:hypothetical protein